MSAGRVCAPLLAAALLVSCAGGWTRSYQRWEGYMNDGGPYAEWARCVRARSYHYLDTDNLPRSEVIVGNDAQVFTNVLADCRPHMTGQAWNDVLPEEMERLLADAHRAFFGARADINARMAEAITN